MGDIATQHQAQHGALALTEIELLDVLQVSIYPGAARPSIKLALAYCKANDLDIFQKPVHIVPMWDKNSRSMRDVIMPGIGLYRTQAARSNALAGISEPEFGQTVDMAIDGIVHSVPEWCRVSVKRLLPNGSIAEYFAKEYWIENYATAGKDSMQPNAMWKKRPRGQLAKCAQAQALRTAFPEMVSAAPTAEEMEGKPLHEVDITPPPTEKVTTPSAANIERKEALLASAKISVAKGLSAYEAFYVSIGVDGRRLLASDHPQLKADAAKADAERTIDAEPAKPAKVAPASHLEGLVADLEAVADEGLAAFGAAWSRMSDATRNQLADQYDELRAHAQLAGE